MEMAALGLDIALMIFLLAPAALATAAAVSQDISDPWLAPSHAARRASQKSLLEALADTLRSELQSEIEQSPALQEGSRGDHGHTFDQDEAGAMEHSTRADRMVVIRSLIRYAAQRPLGFQMFGVSAARSIFTPKHIPSKQTGCLVCCERAQVVEISFTLFKQITFAFFTIVGGFAGWRI